MDNPTPQINIIKPDSGPKFSLPKMPKVSPIMVVIATILLAVVTVVSVAMLYQRKDSPVAIPTPVEASTTTTITDDFQQTSSVNWTFPAQSSVTNGQLVNTFPAVGSSENYAYVKSNHIVQGDFSTEIQNVSLTASGANGSAELGFFDSQDRLLARVSRYKSATTDRVEAEFELPGEGGIDAISVDMPSNTGSIKLKLVRIGNVGQAFYDTGTGYKLLTSRFDWATSIGHFTIYSTQLNPDFPQTTAVFDNFSAQVNIVDAPTPAPGTPAACAVSFTVLDTVATGTPAPSATPTPTPTVTPTPPPGSTPTPTPTVTPTPPPGSTSTPTPTPTPLASCNNSCSTNANCSAGLTCSGGMCRNPQCTTQTNCTCTIAATATPTTPVALGPTPTPVTLQTAGSATGTMLIGLGGALILGLGAILMFVL